MVFSPKICIHTLTQAGSSTYSLRKISLKSSPCNRLEDFDSHGSLLKTAGLSRNERICQQRTCYRIRTVICNFKPLLKIHHHYCSNFLHTLFLYKESTGLCTILYQFCLSKTPRHLQEVSSNRALKLHDDLEIVK